MALQIKVDSIAFTGTSGDIGAKLFTHSKTTDRLAVVFPGAGYSHIEPLLRFGIQVLLKEDFKVLALDKIYGHDPKWRSLASEQEARSLVEQDTIKVFQQIQDQFPSSLEILFGRSLGTYAMACLLERNLVKPRKVIWQAPALGNKWEVMRDCEISGFGILGTADPLYDKAIKHLPKDRIIIEDADHAMEVDGDPIRTIEILKEVTMATEEWIRK